jgi:hypothetical protein
LTLEKAVAIVGYTIICYESLQMLRVKARLALISRRAPLAHVLSCLLLSTLIFSATFGSVHHHESPSGTPRRVTVESVSVYSDVGVNSVSPADENGSQTNNPLQSKDCSICQLQRHLTGILLYGPVFTPAPPSEHAFELVVSAPYLSATAHPRRGRAPPQTSL